MVNKEESVLSQGVGIVRRSLGPFTLTNPSEHGSFFRLYYLLFRLTHSSRYFPKFLCFLLRTQSN